MAVVQSFNNQDNSENSQLNQQPQGTQQDANVNKPVNVSGNGGGTSDAGNSAAPTVGAPTSSGRFNNIQNYLNANKNYNAQGNGLAGQVYGNLQGQEQGIEKGFQGDQSTYQNTVNGGRVAWNQTLADKAVNTPEALSPEETAAYTKMRDASYGGPTSLSSGQDYINKADQYGQLTGLTNSAAGRGTLLQKLYGGNGNYSQGENSLDNLLLSANPNQLNTLQQAGTLSSGLTNTINTGLQSDKDLASAVQQQNASTRQQTRDALSAALQNFATDSQAKLAAAQAAQAGIVNGYKGAADAGQVAGLPTGPTYGVDASNFVTSSAPTLQSVISQADQDRINNLYKLSGGIYGDTSVGAGTKEAQELSPFIGNTKAGSYSQGGTPAVNVDALKKARDDAKTKFINDVNNLYPTMSSNVPTSTQGPFNINSAELSKALSAPSASDDPMGFLKYMQSINQLQMATPTPTTPAPQMLPGNALNNFQNFHQTTTTPQAAPAVQSDPRLAALMNLYKTYGFLPDTGSASAQVGHKNNL